MGQEEPGTPLDPSGKVRARRDLLATASLGCCLGSGRFNRGVLLVQEFFKRACVPSHHTPIDAVPLQHRLPPIPRQKDMSPDALSLKLGRIEKLRQLHLEEGIECSNPGETRETHMSLAHCIGIRHIPFFVDAQPAVLTATQLSKKSVTSASVAR